MVSTLKIKVKLYLLEFFLYFIKQLKSTGYTDNSSSFRTSRNSFNMPSK